MGRPGPQAAVRGQRAFVGPDLIELHFSHCFQFSCQWPHPLVGSSLRGEPVMMIGSRIRVFLMNHAASDGLTFTHPWLTLELPCEPTDQGALCTYSPLLEMRTVLYTVSW